MKKIFAILIVLMCNGCSYSWGYRKTMMDSRGVEVTARTFPFDYRQSEIEARFYWSVIK